MNSEKRKVLSYCMALLLVFTTVFQGSFIVNAATLKHDGNEVTKSNGDFTITTNEKGQTVYTLNKDVKDGLKLVLKEGESAILDGKNHTIDGKDGLFISDSATGQFANKNSTPALTVEGKGTLTIKNATLNGGDLDRYNNGNISKSGSTGVVVEGFCNLILDETVTMKGKVYSTGYDDGKIYENPGLDFSGNQLVMKENSNITIQGGGNSGADGSITFKGHLLDIEDGVTFQIGKLKVFDNGIYDKNSIISKKINKSDIIGASASKFYNLTIISKCGEKVLRSEKYLKYIGRSIAISKIAELPVLDASKYELEGWYVDADMTGPLTEGEELSEKEEGTTIYADYKQIAGDVTFQSNGGSQVAKERVKFGEKVKQPANPTKSGYTFKGWYKDAACTSAYDFDASVSEDITLYAKWEEVAKPPVNPTVKKSITKATVSKIKSVTYSGFYKKPSVTVKYAGKKLKNGSDYTLSYKNNKKVGKATVIIKGKGNYTGTKKVTFKIKTRKKGVYAKGIYKVDVGGLAGHKKASSKSEVIVHYPKGKKLEVTKVIRKKTPKKTYVWLKVKYKGKTSYIYGKYVK